MIPREVELHLRHKLNRSKRRAKSRNLAHDLDLAYLMQLWHEQGGCCALTGTAMAFTSGNTQDKNPLVCSIDRRDSKGGYVKGNIQLVCHWANNAKSTWDQAVFTDMIRKAYNNNCKITRFPLQLFKLK